MKTEGVSIPNIGFGGSGNYLECPFCDCAYGPNELWRGYDCSCCAGAGYVNAFKLELFRANTKKWRPMVYGDILDFQEWLTQLYAGPKMTFPLWGQQ